MFERIGRRKYKAGVKLRKLTVGLLNHIEKSDFIEDNGE